MESPVFGNIGAETGGGINSSPTDGAILLEQVYESFGEFPQVPDYDISAAPKGLGVGPPADIYDIAASVPEYVGGVDPVAHERDILYIANQAMERGGVTTISGFARWLDVVHSNAVRSGKLRVTDKDRHFPRPPPVVELAEYLRETERIQSQVANR